MLNIILKYIKFSTHTHTQQMQRQICKDLLNILYTHLTYLALTEQNPSRGLIGISGVSGGVALLDSVERDIRAHVREIEGKILIIVDNLLGGQISKWTARPPVPSKSFRNISR